MDWRWSAACVQRVGRGHIVSPRAQLVSSFCGMVFFVNPTVNNPIRSFQEPIPKMFVFSQRITAWCFHGSAATAVECLAHQLGSVQPGTIPFRLLPQPSTLPPLLRGRKFLRVGAVVAANHLSCPLFHARICGFAESFTEVYRVAQTKIPHL